MPTPGIRLGVDFGTSNTVAVVRWPDGRSRPLLFDGSPLLPSAVYAEASGAIVVGRDAVHSARLEPARFEPNPKRRIDDGTVLLGDRELPVGELIAAVLRRVSDEWQRTVGQVTPEVTVTYPASWGATRRLIVADAAAHAGLGRVRLVPEPVAAAAYFTQVLGRDVPIGSVVVVHDFGAGTFDASVVARTSGGFEVLAVDGRDDIGGVDVDDAIVAHIGAGHAEADAANWKRLMGPSTVEDRRARRLLWDDARVAKERLSRQPTADLTVPLLNIDVHLTREELETLARPLLEQTVRVTQGVMRWARLAEGRIAGVFLVGGSSRIPLVATLLHRALGEAPVAIEQPELVVAEGSMLTGAAPTPVSGAPAPGPATGAIAVAGAHGAHPQTGGDRPAGAPVVPLRPDSPLPLATSQIPADRLPAQPTSPPSGVPVSSPPLGPASGVPVSSPPLGPASGPPVPVSTPPTGQYPVSAPPAPVSTPPSGQQPIGGPYRAFTPPTGQHPVSAPPAGQQPVSGPPGSGMPGPTRSAGRVFVSGSAPVSPAVSNAPVSPAVSRPTTGQMSPAGPPTRYDEYGAPVRPESYPVAQRRPAARPVPNQEPAQRARRRGGFGRAVRTLLVALLLIATPVVAAYVAYFLTTNEWPPPVDRWLTFTGS